MKVLATIFSALLFAGYSLADDLTIPNTFTAGTPARAADVNANFTAVEASVDDNAADIASNAADIAANAADVATNAAGVSSNATSVSSLDAVVADHETRLQQIEGELVIGLTDNGDGTVTDNQTGLMWEKKNAADGVVDLTNPNDADNKYHWTSAADGDTTNPDGDVFTLFLAQLNGVIADTASSEQLGGYNDWRLPTSWELQSIVDCSFGNPCIDPIFGPIAYCCYWSFTTSIAPVPKNVWGFNFITALVVNDSKQGMNQVRAVRGGR